MATESPPPPLPPAAPAKTRDWSGLSAIYQIGWTVGAMSICKDAELQPDEQDFDLWTDRLNDAMTKIVNKE